MSPSLELRRLSLRASLQSALMRSWAKPVLFVLCLLPLVLMMWALARNAAGPNPAEYLIRHTGSWGLRWLCITLAVTPLRQWSGLSSLARFRRMLGLFCFFYVCLHLLSYAWLDKGWSLHDMVRDIGKRPFILVGFTAWTLLLPLAATSFNRAIKALGAPRWQRLHRLIYVIVGLALLHFYWMRAGKHNFAEVEIYAAIVFVLLGARLWRRTHR